MSDPALVLVGTPIGNLGDLSPRASAALASADVIACEDTRRARQLLAAAGVPAPRLVAVHEHNEASMVGWILERIAAGARVAVVADAGMPGISDPGERLVRAAVRAGLGVEVVPGPSAVVAALVVSGLPTRRWCFEGFLPRKGRERAERLAEVASHRGTTVLYESPRRVEATLRDLVERCGPERRVAVVRELTKLFEEVWRGTLAEALDRAANQADAARGEQVIVLDGAPEPPPATDAEIARRLAAGLAAGIDRKVAVAEVAAALGVSRRRVYDLAVGLRRPR